MTELMRASALDGYALSDERYFESLMRAARAAGLIAPDAAARIEEECLALLSHLAARQSAGDSTSIRIERAQELMASIAFTVSLALKGCACPEGAARALVHRPISELYRAGRAAVDRLVSSTGLMHAQLKRRLFDSPNHFYRATLVDGLGAFFAMYNPEYGAHKVPITVDYPLFCPPPALRGIEFIRAYVEAAQSEDRFLRCFAPGAVDRLMRAHFMGYREVPINLFGWVLTAALGCELAGTAVDALDATEPGARALIGRFRRTTDAADARAEIAPALGALNRRLALPPAVKRYAQNALKRVAQDVALAARERTLERLFFRVDN